MEMRRDLDAGATGVGISGVGCGHKS